jgi:hypothetical protein
VVATNVVLPLEHGFGLRRVIGLVLGAVAFLTPIIPVYVLFFATV